MRSYDQVKLDMLRGWRVLEEERDMVADIEDNGVCPDCGLEQVIGPNKDEARAAKHKTPCR